MIDQETFKKIKAAMMPVADELGTYIQLEVRYLQWAYSIEDMNPQFIIRADQEVNLFLTVDEMIKWLRCKETRLKRPKSNIMDAQNAVSSIEMEKTAPGHPVEE